MNIRNILLILLTFLLVQSCNTESKKVAHKNCLCFEKIDPEENELEFHFQMNKCFSETDFLTDQVMVLNREDFINTVIDELQLSCSDYNQLMQRYVSSMSELKTKYYCSQSECKKAKKGVYKILDSFYNEINYTIGDTLFHHNLTTGIIVKAIQTKLSPCLSVADPFYSNDDRINALIQEPNRSIYTRILSVKGDTVILEGTFRNNRTLSRQIWLRENP